MLPTTQACMHDFNTIGCSREFYKEISNGQLSLQYLNLNVLVCNTIKEQDLKSKLCYIQDFAMPQKAKEQRRLVHT